jgi:hypothetical protein
MIIMLINPPIRNWLLIGDQLNDPQDWTRFVPCHSANSDRYLFDSTVKEMSSGIKIKLCPNLLSRGRSVFEYDWETDEAVILAHALSIAEKIDAELSFGEQTDPLWRSAA